MASFEASTRKAMDKATEGTATVTSTPVVDSDFSIGQTYHAFSKGTTKTEVEIYSENADRPTYFVTDAKTTFSSASDLTVYRESKDGPVVAHIRLPSSRSGPRSAAVITYPSLEAAIVRVPAGKEVLSSEQSVHIDGRDYIWQGEKRGDRPGLPIQVLRDEQGDTWAMFVWDPMGWDSRAQPGAFGRLLLVDIAINQDLLDQIVATAVARVFQQIKRETVNSIAGQAISACVPFVTDPIIIFCIANISS
ncbi:hypothetical protein EPUS_09403 [Endocarpon pusillum Z07020]|uniref:Uncharacterized protein n=1 Tax=Endocarpon pusillum (strain Z07020 / HMAS-L-300199) TaxID=1263415 RepID=U1GKP1_ENDPU|nr:uncharacterized protein EPUS_09403 [Endocarpon pusillum Z07020]ERF72773.1 hypothetical protein EPUS_09403 [Endocarpon pusillum Z07020]